ncbi:MAG: hypothetical protein GW762_03650, partial [Candidatus Pacebacteria bacterium]|nr:hypothetical protein [Candidatus Paceibacterota bacterium]
FNVTSGEKSSSNYNVTDTVGQTAAGAFGEYGTSGYFVGAGFQYIYQIKTFSFIISDLTMDLGELTDGAFGTDNHTLEITTRGAGGYTIYAYEQHPLRIPTTSYIINDTTCDAGTCTTSAASIWTNPSIDGFGFNIQGDDIPTDFVNNTYFRPFANDEAAATMQPVMSSSNIALQRTSTVTYQAAKAGDTAAGQFQTAVVYVAVPGY